jgi:hypothetical protein
VKEVVGPPQPPETAKLCVEKFYDANANGVADVGEVLIDGWKVRISDGISLIRFTPTCNVIEPDTYSVFEFDPIETNWVHTTPQLIDGITLAANEAKTVFFGTFASAPAEAHPWILEQQERSGENERRGHFDPGTSVAQFFEPAKWFRWQFQSGNLPRIPQLAARRDSDQHGVYALGATRRDAVEC